jgi:hypothetical protein
MPAPTAKHDPTPLFARQILALFRDEALAGVQFPELDLEVLEQAESALSTAQIEVERAEAQLQAARAARDAKLSELEIKAERALAYVRVFASGDATLQARVAELGRKKQAPAGDAAPVKKRTRAKRSADAAELFEDAAAADGVSERQPVLAS